MDYLEVAHKLVPPDPDGDSWFSVCGYDLIIGLFGNVAIEVSDDDWQGDTRILYAETGNGFGYLQFGWGSCSGCDALQACDNHAELAKLIQELEEGIKWMPRDEMLKFFKEHDWEGDYSCNESEQRNFVSQVIAHLEAI